MYNVLLFINDKPYKLLNYLQKHTITAKSVFRVFWPSSYFYNNNNECLMNIYSLQKPKELPGVAETYCFL